MELTKIVCDNAKDFTFGLCIGFAVDIVTGTNTVEQNALIAAGFAGFMGLAHHYLPKLARTESIPLKENIRKTSALTLGVFTGKCIYTACDYFSKGN